MKQWIYILILGCSVTTLAGQQSIVDSLNTMESVDSTVTVATDTLALADTKKAKRKKQYPNPKRAALLGLTIPGAGHLYNKKILKAVFVYAAAGGAVYFIDYNTDRYNLTNDAYCQKLIIEGIRDSALTCGISRYTSNNIAQYDFIVDNFSSTSIRSFRDNFDNFRQLSWVGLVIGHLLLNGVWPFIDAHLLDFDISDDLSLKLEPMYRLQGRQHPPLMGFSAKFKF